ncbi:c-type cytochrome [Tranquillimonas alkanivorans]|uniref:Cytochrome c n=1 Tax=Tranquillimonas alkanivorans TaxID=441119 RepID=A0A1I5V3L5_9RHOB|nr:c-type cytochrome [Tranquillimonas alkanivorans]SFQ02144.1 Cytochrome c [Tranquillimonas alkanivorans]
MIEQMCEVHAGHEHSHDFEAMEDIEPEQMERVMKAMLDLGLALPPLRSVRGQEIFAEKGCEVCHSVNGVDGEIGPSLNATDTPGSVNVFHFAARMGRGAAPMVQKQKDLFGEKIDRSGEELSALVAFAHDEEEQRNLSPEQVPARFKELISE